MASQVTVNSRLSWAKFAVALMLVIATAFLSPQPTFQAQQGAGQKGAWLHRPLVNWNNRLELPPPVAAIDREELQARCPNLLRQPDTRIERELVDAGWLLYGSLQSFDLTRVVTALSSADSLCRPIGYQAFVYFGDSYAGTLSPDAMDSLTNGALTHIRLDSAISISAEFARYREGDPSCCPGRMSYVTFRANSDEPRRIVPVEIVTRSLCPDSRVPETPATSAARLFEVKWRLTEINGVALTTQNPYLRFEGAARIWSANGGCNQVAGGFVIDGASLTLSSSASTRMACVDAEAQQLETDFLKALGQVTRFQIEDDSLRLYDCGTLLLVFRPDTAVRKTP